jgi:sterol desaturase/sphingolipid hydroxylase (fatty acid hydroxylase superfamily)
VHEQFQSLVEALLPSVVILCLLLQHFFPLVRRNSLLARPLLFHFFCMGVILAQVSLLNRYSFFPQRPDLGFSYLSVGIALLALDLLSYIWHRLNHRLEFLWRWHRFHHEATSLDALAAYRFHPIEILLGYQLRAIAVFLLGLSAAELTVFVSVFGAMNVFQHSGVRLPWGFDKALSWILVTPRRHHVHHYKTPEFHDSNFATVFMFWDRLFGTYKEPLPDEQIQLGL